VTLDPITARDVGSTQAIGKVFDALYTYGDGTALRPQLAAGPPTTEGPRTLRIELDGAARFQNDAPVTAADVRYSLTAPVEADTAARAAVSAIETVEVVDDRTLRLRLRHPSPALDRALTQPVVPKAVREADPEGFATDPVGSGPFTVESFSEEKRLQLARWPDYPGRPAPAVDRVTVAAIESPITQLTSLRTGRTDVVEPVSAQLDGGLADVAGAAVATRPSYRSLYFGLNTNDGPTERRAVREAIAHCLDLDIAVEAFVGGLGHRQYGPVPPQVADAWDFPREAWRSRTARKDIGRARELFAAAETGERLTILTSKHPLWKEFAEHLARGIRDADQPARVDAVNWKTYLERSVSGAATDYHVFVGELAGTPDPDSFLYPAVHENAQGLTNGVFYNEEAVMTALLEARRTTDRAERRAHYTAASRRLLAERVILPICSLETSFAADPSVQGLHPHPIPRLNPRVVGPDGVVTVGDES
jgi:peptide/nickel transport system substrate-binding protein